MERGLHAFARALAKVYERAAIELPTNDLRAFVLHQSAQVANVSDQKDRDAFLRRSRRMLAGLIRSGQHFGMIYLPSDGWARGRVAAGYALLTADPAASWAAAHLPIVGNAISAVLNALPNLS